MLKELIQGKRYHLEFIAPYTHKGPYDIEISAITKKETLSIYGDFDIRGTFFDEVGIKTYLTMVSDDTDIYICHPIKSKDPIEVKTDDFIFIPKTLIDYGKSEEFKIMTRFKFTLEGVRRHFDSNYEANQFIEELESEIPNKLLDTKTIANDLVTISNTQDEILLLQSVIEKEEDDRQRFIDMRENNKLELKKAEAEREMKYLTKLKSVESREKVISEKEGVIDRNVLQSENSKIIGNAFLKMTDDYIKRIKTIYEIILRQSAGINLPSWDELLVQLTISTDPDNPEISLEDWKNGVQSYMSGGKFPDSWRELEKQNCPYCGTNIENIINNVNTLVSSMRKSRNSSSDESETDSDE